MEEYQSDNPQNRWMEHGAWLKCLLESLHIKASKLISPVVSAAGYKMRGITMDHNMVGFGRYHKAAFGPSGSYLFS